MIKEYFLEKNKKKIWLKENLETGQENILLVEGINLWDYSFMDQCDKVIKSGLASALSRHKLSYNFWHSHSQYLCNCSLQVNTSPQLFPKCHTIRGGGACDDTVFSHQVHSMESKSQYKISILIKKIQLNSIELNFKKVKRRQSLRFNFQNIIL